MIDHNLLADRLNAASISVRSQGGLTWERVDAWSIARMPANGTRGGGMADGADDDERIDDRREDAAAARYRGELETLTRRLEADLHRLTRIMAICNPDPPKNLHTKDLQLAQVAADGWCTNCWRDDQHLEPIAMQKARNGVMVPKYRDLCGACGKWKGNTGELPDIEVLRTWHRGGRVRVAAG